MAPDFWKTRIVKIVRACEKKGDRIMYWPEHALPGSGIGAAFGQFALAVVTCPVTIPLASPYLCVGLVLERFLPKKERSSGMIYIPLLLADAFFTSTVGRFLYRGSRSQKTKRNS